MIGAALLDELQRLLDEASGHVQIAAVCEVQAAGRSLPVHAVTLGNTSPEVPAVGFFGGVHGLERIGAEVVIAYLRHVLQRLAWDDLLQTQLQRLRMVFMPLVNPGGLLLGTRANPRGVDLMRNSPVESPHVLPMLLGGQRISARLPWYRGELGAPMEAESRALCEVVERELLTHAFSLSVDCHSGFGVRDRIWFPYAHTALPIAHLAELEAFARVFDAAQPYHRYLIEPQSHQYLTHGDLWDHLYQQSLAGAGRVFLPLTLEMGSWLWVRKNPRQFLSRHGLFNPLIQHRQERVLRRHIGALDFVARAAMSHARWCPAASQREVYRERALDRWYRARPR
jgi:hypothetical protein